MMKARHQFNHFVPLLGALATLASLLGACAPMKTIDAGNATALSEDFSVGRIVLSSGPGGIANFVQNRGALRALYGSGDWSNLSKRVIQIDYGMDLDYFYLGASAEGLGFDDAAKIYYLQAASTIHHCKSAIKGDDCDGFRFPDEIFARLTKLRTKSERAGAPDAGNTTSVTSAPGFTPEQAAAIMADRRARAIASARPSLPPDAPGTAATPLPATPRGAATAATAPGRSLQIAGVRLGMTRSEAVAALHRFGPRLQIVDQYTAFGNGLLYTAGRTNFSPANVAFFSRLVAVDRGELGGASNARAIETATAVTYGPECGRVRGEHEKLAYRVLFSVDLVDPRVVLVEERHWYCAHDVTVATAVQHLYEQFTPTVARRLRIRDDGLRVTPDTYPSVNDGAAFLEWRYGAPAAGAMLTNQIQVPMVNAWGAYWMIGNPGGGIAVHAEIRPANDLTYMGTVQTILWDDDAMANFYQRQNAMVSELDRLGIGIAQLGDHSRIAQVRLP